MGSSLSTDEIIQRATITIKEVKVRVSSIESTVSSLEKRFLNFEISNRKNQRAIHDMEEYVTNLRLLEEGRSFYSIGGKYHTRSNYNG